MNSWLWFDANAALERQYSDEIAKMGYGLECKVTFAKGSFQLLALVGYYSSKISHDEQEKVKCVLPKTFGFKDIYFPVSTDFEKYNSRSLK